MIDSFGSYFLSIMKKPRPIFLRWSRPTHSEEKVEFSVQKVPEVVFLNRFKRI